MLRAMDSDTPATAYGKLAARQEDAAGDLPTVGLEKSAPGSDFSTVVWTTATRPTAPQFPTLPTAPAVDHHHPSTDQARGGAAAWNTHLDSTPENGLANEPDLRLADRIEMRLPDDPDRWIRLTELTVDPLARSLTIRAAEPLPLPPNP